MALEETRTRKGEMYCIVCAVKTGMVRNLTFSEAVWKQICPEMYYNCVLLECCLWKLNLKGGIVKGFIVTAKKSEENALKGEKTVLTDVGDKHRSVKESMCKNTSLVLNYCLVEKYCFVFSGSKRCLMLYVPSS